MRAYNKHKGKTVRESVSFWCQLDDSVDIKRQFVLCDLKIPSIPHYTLRNPVPQFENVHCTDIDEQFNLYKKIATGEKITFNEKKRFSDFLQSLKENGIKHTKVYVRNSNAISHFYYVPVTHIVDMTKSKLDIRYDLKGPGYVMYLITFTNKDFSHDDTIWISSPFDRWDWSKDTRPKSSKKSMLNIDLREQMRDYYDSLEDDGYVLYDDLNDPELD